MRRSRKNEIFSAVDETTTTNEIGGKMSNLPTYSTLFTTLYDEASPIGTSGHDTHYSVFRAVEWMDGLRDPLDTAQIHDFAVAWDEDHDARVISAIEKIYLAGLLSPVLFVGEHKGWLTVIVSAQFANHHTEEYLREHRNAIRRIAESLEDPWELEVGWFDKKIDSGDHFAIQHLTNLSEWSSTIYLGNINLLWNLGIKEMTFG